MKRSLQLAIAAGLLGLVAIVTVQTLTPRDAAAQDELPLSTRLTPAMVEFFGLEAAYARPSFAALAQCASTPACGGSDSSRVTFRDASGSALATPDLARTTTVEHVRRLQRRDSTGVGTVSTVAVRRYSKDPQGRLVMQGTDTITKHRPATDRAPASVLTHVRRYSDVRYLENNARFIWPITGLVVLEVATAEPVLAHLAQHAAVSFDGSARARIITTSGLTHRADMAGKTLETELPSR